VFSDPLAIVVADAIHDERSILIGQSAKRRVLFTVFVELSLGLHPNHQRTAGDGARKENL
jgi:hypothetical protein